MSLLMGKKYKISDDEKALFRQAVAGAKPISHNQITPKPQRPPAVARQTELDKRQVLADMMSDSLEMADFETGEELLFSRDIPTNTLRKLRRGKYRLDAELDLHRMTSEQARQAIATFITNCKGRGCRCVRIIHGKGNSSLHKIPVLKGKVDLWLRKRNDVLAFCSARPADGGTGAVYVLLKKH